jgi:hypothetical protein
MYQRKNLEMPKEQVRANRGSGGVEGESWPQNQGSSVASAFVPLTLFS